jgi:hypothetical protein
MSKSDAILSPTAAYTRRFDLDWLRIIVFSLLIFYHIGMFFNTEDWHAKSSHINGAMEPLMWLSSPWRLPCCSSSPVSRSASCPTSLAPSALPVIASGASSRSFCLACM